MQKTLNAIGRFFIRISAFLRKEIANVLRQPRLIITLVLGPFLILLIFGLGFSGEAPKLRTLFVAREENVLRPYIEEYATRLGPQLVFVGIVENRGDAIMSLHRGDVDVVVDIPPQPMAKLDKNEPVTLEIFHNEIRPDQAGYTQFTMELYIRVLNQRVLVALLEDQQQEIISTRDRIQSAQTQARDVREALASEEVEQAQESIVALDEALQEITRTNQTTAGGQPITSSILALTQPFWISDTMMSLSEARQSTQALRNSELQDLEDERANTALVEEELAQMDATLAALQRLEANIVTSPFAGDVNSITPTQPETIDYFTPAVLALLLQHLCVTFAALSIVQEELIGAMELFEVAPISALEMLLGKYLSYLLFNGLITAVLTGLTVYGLGVPMVGNWLDYGLTMLAMMFAALGFGFLISLLSNTTSQAVQVSMLLLLSSVFFTGFMQELDAFRQWTRVVSWALPATYSIELLKDIMLRGQAVRQLLVYGMVGMGGALFAVNWLLLRRHLAEL
jgi:ABC-2 type transport system permease protein